jgi:isoquinoline 1-oxidoreductase subunit beta
MDFRGIEKSNELTRRQFVKLTALAGSGLTLGLILPGCGSRPGATGGAAAPLTSAASPPESHFAMPFVHIAPDSTVTVLSKHLEAGQGVWTGLPAIVAEELDASWSQMRVASAPAAAPPYGNLAFDPTGHVQATGGSTSVANSWLQLRRAGATARALLVQAAAARWSVPAQEVTVVGGVVSHAPSRRQASFGELATDASRLPVPEDVKLKDPARFTLIGRGHLPRLDTRDKSSGKERYAIDVMLPGMMTAVVMRPPRFGGKAASFDASKAKAVPGVVDVVEIPRGVAVIGRDLWSAKKGREALKVSWDESAAEKRGTAELLAQYRRLAAGSEALTAAKRGNVDAALARAHKVIHADFEFPYLAHAPMEPMTAVCRLSPGRCEIWAGCQFQTGDQMNAAKVTGLNPRQVTINTLAAGGSFGRHANFESDYIVEVASIAKATGGRYPVRLIWTREDDITGGLYRPLNFHRIAAGVGRDGKVAYRQRVVGQSIMAGSPFGAPKGVDPTAIEGNAADEYDLDDVSITWTKPEVGIPVLWWRSVGHTHMAFSKEVIIDELAESAAEDPVAFRLRLLGKHPRQSEALRLVAEKSGWHQPFAGGKGRGRGVAVHGSFGSVVAEVAEVTVSGNDIAVDRVVCALDCGIAVTPDVVVAQMQSGIGYGLSAALWGEITLTDGRVDQSNFDGYRVMRINEMPKVVEVYILPSTSSPSGVGEPGTPPIAPAVANAVRMATGIRLRRMPFNLAAAREEQKA